MNDWHEVNKVGYQRINEDSFFTNIADNIRCLSFACNQLKHAFASKTLPVWKVN